MKIILENSDYIEVKKNNFDKVVLSIKTNYDDKKSIVISADLEKDTLDKLITNLVYLRSKVYYDEQA